MAETSEKCGERSIMMRAVCALSRGHDGPHIAFLPNATYSWGFNYHQRNLDEQQKADA